MKWFHFCRVSSATTSFEQDIQVKMLHFSVEWQRALQMILILQQLAKKRSLDSDKREKSLHFPSFLVSHRHRSTVVRWLSYEYVKCYLRTIPRAYSLLFFPLAYVIFFHPSRCIYGVCMFLSCIYFFRIFFSRLLPIQRRRRQKSEKTEQKKKIFFTTTPVLLLNWIFFFSSFLFFFFISAL